MDLKAARLALLLSAFGLGSLLSSRVASTPVALPGPTPYIGEITWVPYNFAPRGWAFCDGRLMRIEENQALFSLVGTTYGGDGRTTFGLPDLRGRVPVGAGDGAGLTSRKLGTKGGAESVTLTIAQLPNHSHSLHTNSGEGEPGDGGAALLRSSLSVTTAPADGAVPTIRPEGGGQAHENMPPFQALNAVIALEGVYPSRG